MSPAYRVAIHIVTPGPDLEAEGQDHTIRAAIGKAFLDLETRLRDREHKLIRRVRGNLQTPVALRSGWSRR
jgi:ribosome-associated translation inhibitor RaiA